MLFKNDVVQIEKTISSFLNSNASTYLYLIDNSPTDELSSFCNDSRVEYIHNPTNPGFGAAHNIALKKAIKMGAKYHLVLNPDVYFDSKVLPELIRFMDANPDVGNVMPKVIYPNGSLHYLCKLLPTPLDWFGRRFSPFRKRVDSRNQKFELRFTGYSKIMEVPYLSGCFMFFRLDALKKIGFFDENIFMYGEETDICRRLIAYKFRNIFYPEVTIVHEFAKGSHKTWHLTWIGVKSAVYYFNKWGWFFDKERERINKDALQNLLN